MQGQGSYVPPPYIPLGQSDKEPEDVSEVVVQAPTSSNDGPVQWSSGICACCDDMPSCMLLSDL